MSIALVVTAGFGNGTLSGTIKGVVLRGYDIAAAAAFTAPHHVMNIKAESRIMSPQTENRIMSPQTENRILSIGV